MTVQAVTFVIMLAVVVAAYASWWLWILREKKRAIDERVNYAPAPRPAAGRRHQQRRGPERLRETTPKAKRPKGKVPTFYVDPARVNPPNFELPEPSLENLLWLEGIVAMKPRRLEVKL